MAPQNPFTARTRPLDPGGEGGYRMARRLPVSRCSSPLDQQSGKRQKTSRRFELDHSQQCQLLLDLYSMKQLLRSSRLHGACQSSVRPIRQSNRSDSDQLIVRIHNLSGWVCDTTCYGCLLSSLWHARIPGLKQAITTKFSI